eukprot:PhM_4_TR13165/c0_g1_i1/m.61757
MALFIPTTKRTHFMVALFILAAVYWMTVVYLFDEGAVEQKASSQLQPLLLAPRTDPILSRNVVVVGHSVTLANDTQNNGRRPREAQIHFEAHSNEIVFDFNSSTQRWPKWDSSDTERVRATENCVKSALMHYAPEPEVVMSHENETVDLNQPSAVTPRGLGALMNHDNGKERDDTPYDTCRRLERFENSEARTRPVPPQPNPPRTEPTCPRGPWLLDCRPCRGKDPPPFHNVVAASRRLFLFERGAVRASPTSSDALVFRELYVALNWDSMIVSVASVGYNSSCNEYYVRDDRRAGRGYNVTLRHPTVARLQVVQAPRPAYSPSGTMNSSTKVDDVGALDDQARYHVHLGSNVIIESRMPPEVSSLLRSLQLISQAKLLQCTSSSTCSAICPSNRFPYIPCANLEFTTSADMRKFPSYDFQTESLPPPMSDLRLGVCLAGLVRAYELTLPKLRSEVLERHAVADVFLSTWNLVGLVEKGKVVRGKGDLPIPPVKLLYHLRRQLGHRLVDAVILDYKMHAPYLLHLEKHQFYYHSRIHLHIRNSVQLMLASRRKYDAVMITRPDVFWFHPMMINSIKRKRQPSALFIASLIGPTAVVINDGDVAVHKTDSLFWGSTWSAGDWVHVGTPSTMAKWVHLYNYSVQNFITQGGGISHADFMIDVGQRWVVTKFPIALLRARCTSQRGAVSMHGHHISFDSEKRCYWGKRYKF